MDTKGLNIAQKMKLKEKLQNLLQIKKVNNLSVKEMDDKIKELSDAIKKELKALELKLAEKKSVKDSDKESAKNIKLAEKNIEEVKKLKELVKSLKTLTSNSIKLSDNAQDSVTLFETQLELIRARLQTIEEEPELVIESKNIKVEEKVKSGKRIITLTAQDSPTNVTLINSPGGAPQSGSVSLQFDDTDSVIFTVNGNVVTAEVDWRQPGFIGQVTPNEAAFTNITGHGLIKFLSDSNILVNTTSQSIDGGNKLEIKGTSAAGGNSYFVATSASGARQMYFGVTESNAFLGAFLNHSFELRVNNSQVATYSSTLATYVTQAYFQGNVGIKTSSPRGVVDVVGTDGADVHDVQPDNGQSSWFSMGKGGSDLDGNFNGGNGGDIVFDPGTPGSGNEIGAYGAVRVIDRLTADPLSPTGYKEVFAVSANGGAGVVNFYDSAILLTSFQATYASFGPTGAAPQVAIVASGIDTTHPVATFTSFNDATANIVEFKKKVSNVVTTVVYIDDEGVLFPVQAVTASAPTYTKGGIYFDTTLNKLRVGGASGWETITSV